VEKKGASLLCARKLKNDNRRYLREAVVILKGVEEQKP
jgi:hypothetical protein